MSFLLHNEHWEYKHISPHEVSIAKSVGLQEMKLWGAVYGCASLPVSCCTTLLTGEAGLTGQQTAALVRQSTRHSLEKLPVLLWSTFIPAPVCLAGRKPRGPTHPRAHLVSLQMQSPAPGHPVSGRLGSPWAGAAAEVFVCPEWRLWCRTQSSRISAGVVEVRQKSAGKKYGLLICLSWRMRWTIAAG